jgi:hypothetical protein
MRKFLCAFAVTAVIFASCGKNEMKDTITAEPSTPVQTPVAAPVPAPPGFTAAVRIDDQAAAKEGTGIQFVNSSTGAISYKWDFGNGQSMKVKDPLYTYPACGTYEVTLTAFDANGTEKTTVQEIVVNCIFAPSGKHIQHDPLF